MERLRSEWGIGGGRGGYVSVRPVLQIWLLSQVSLIGILDVCLYRPDWSTCHLEMGQLCVDDVELCPDHLHCVTTKARGKRQGVR